MESLYSSETFSFFNQVKCASDNNTEFLQRPRNQCVSHTFISVDELGSQCLTKLYKILRPKICLQHAYLYKRKEVTSLALVKSAFMYINPHVWLHTYPKKQVQLPDIALTAATGLLLSEILSPIEPPALGTTSASSTTVGALLGEFEPETRSDCSAWFKAWQCGQ